MAESCQDGKSTSEINCIQCILSCTRTQPIFHRIFRKQVWYLDRATEVPIWSMLTHTYKKNVQTYVLRPKPCFLARYQAISRLWKTRALLWAQSSSDGGGGSFSFVPRNIWVAFQNAGFCRSAPCTRYRSNHT